MSRFALALSALLVMVSCGGRTTTANPTSTTSAVVTTTSTATVASTTVPTTTTTTTSTTRTTRTTSTVATTIATTVDSVATKASISANWERFFAASTSLADREALLEHGASYHDALVQRSTDPLQKQASAKVKAVELTAPDQASVTYDVLLNGQVALPDVPGVAVREQGVWKVSGNSFCALVTLGAPQPVPGCS